MPVSIPELIAKKCGGKELSINEIEVFVRGVADGSVAPCQTGAMLMAIYLKGMNRQEYSSMTLQMKNSGSSLSWPEEFHGLLVDKHSTGGVGDKISLVLAPALAACGLKVPMISGRGLGHTGGTLDKLESIPGYNVSLTNEEMVSMLKSPGCFIAGQTGNICPADKKMYEIRDVTATVNSNELINCSIISKKAAENINALVLDVKTGSGAFKQDKGEAIDLAKMMVACSKDLGIKTVALLTDMDSPIGNMVGNSLEVAESIWCLQGKGPADLFDFTVNLGGYALHAHNPELSVEKAKQKINDVISNGSALERWKDMLKGHGVPSQVADDLCDPVKDVWDNLPSAKYKTEIKAPRDGYVERIVAMPVAMAGHKLGGGRNAPGESIDMSVGLELLADIGDKLSQGQAWVRVHHSQVDIPEQVLTLLTDALVMAAEQVPSRNTRLLEVFD